MLTLWIPLVLLSVGAGLHATWNALVKRAGTADLIFIWVYSALAVPVWLGVLAWGLAVGPGLGESWWAALVSMALHTLYAVLLQRGYAAARLAVVYPVSRGLTPILVALAAIPWAGAPGFAQVIALPLVLIGAWLASGMRLREVHRSSGLLAGILIAGCSAAYTLWDAFSVSQLRVATGPYLAVSSLAQFALLTLMLRRRGRELPGAFAQKWRQAAPIAVLVPASYALVLLAMRVAPPATVAIGRSMNVVLGVVVEWWLLRERPARRAATGLAAITLGAALSAV